MLALVIIGVGIYLLTQGMWIAGGLLLACIVIATLNEFTGT